MHRTRRSGPTLRYVILGAGAVGGVIAARLIAAGREVALIARGAHREALAQRGLELQWDGGAWRGPVSVFAHPDEAGLGEGDTVVLAVKSQDTLAAVRALADAAPAGITVVCAQNGVENERVAARWFADVLGAYVYVFATHPGPGVVRCFTAPSFGVIDVGRHPSGVDAATLRIRMDLAAAGFDSRAAPDIMAWKHAKLLANLANAPDAAFGVRAGEFTPMHAARQEALACFRAAGIAHVPAEDSAARFAALLPTRRVNGEAFPGGSTRQSLARGAGETEIDYLTGEIVLLGRLHGVPTPVNAALLALVREMAARGEPPASRDPAAFASSLQAQGHEQDREEAV